MSHSELQGALRDRLQDAFLKNLPIPSETEKHLAAALQETLGNPGSMFRAELAYRGAMSFEWSEENAQALAIALEYFHTASLLFDDLPAMDNAEQRRGVPCVHHQFGEGAAMLAALALINRAYALMWSAFAGVPRAAQQRAMDYLELQLGLTGLLNGQSRDLHYGELPGPMRVPHKVAMGKTVSLIRLPLVLPAVLGSASAGEIRRLECLAVYWGLGYQTLDDLKDVLFPAGEMGKTGARDAQLNRPNQALYYGTTGAFERARRLMRLASRVIVRLNRRRPALSFLGEAHEHFEREMMTLSNIVPAVG